MVFFSLIESVGTPVSVAAQAVVAVVLSWICVELYRGTRNPGTHRGDAMMLDLGLRRASVGQRNPFQNLEPDA